MKIEVGPEDINGEQGIAVDVDSEPPLIIVEIAPGTPLGIRVVIVEDGEDG